MTVLVLEKVVFKKQNITRHKNGYAIIIKHSSLRGHKIINMYTSTNTDLKWMK